MNILNIYFSSTGNTEKVALKIQETLIERGHNVKTMKITSEDDSVDVLKYDFVFVGSGVYGQLPGTPPMDLHRRLLQKYSVEGGGETRVSAKVVSVGCGLPYVRWGTHWHQRGHPGC